MPYPGLLKRGATGPDVVAVGTALAALGYPVTSPPGTYDAGFESVVKLYQSQHFGPDGRPLQDDGRIGPLTWSALFGAVPNTAPVSGIARTALGVAVSQVGVMENPLGSNRGPEVDLYNTTAGAPLGSYWCMAFVYYCFETAARDLNVANPFPKTAACSDAWAKARRARRVIPGRDAVADPSRVKPGAVFILDFGGGHGHTGFVKTCVSGSLKTVEGNTDVQASGNGIGVFELNRRSVMSNSLVGFIDFT